MRSRIHGRRDFLQVGSLSALGLSLANYVNASELANQKRAAKSCILIWLDGGPSHLETFDPKPRSPAEVRGPFGVIPTSVAGIELSELLPQTAKVMQHSAIIRSMTSPLGEHNFGTHYLLTGYKPTPALAYPAIGSVVSGLQKQVSALPNHVAIPNMRVGGSNFKPEGYLSSEFAPFEVGGDPAKADFHVRDLEPFAGIVDERVSRRKTYLDSLNRIQDTAERLSPVDPAFEQAYRLMTSSRAKAAFDLSKESADTKRRYGSKSIAVSYTHLTLPTKA